MFEWALFFLCRMRQLNTNILHYRKALLISTKKKSSIFLWFYLMFAKQREKSRWKSDFKKEIDPQFSMISLKSVVTVLFLNIFRQKNARDNWKWTKNLDTIFNWSCKRLCDTVSFFVSLLFFLLQTHTINVLLRC